MGRAKKAMLKQDISEDLWRLKAAFDEWRATRTVGQRIPAQLWADAAGLATRQGARHVADVLHLEYAGLQRRTMQLTGIPQPVEEPPGPPRFVEMFAPAPAASAELGRAPCVVELVNVRGLSMRVELSGAGMAGLTTLCQAFCAAE